MSSTANPPRLILLPYLQSWDGTSLSLRLLIIPRGDPTAPLLGPSSSTFVSARLTFDAFLTADTQALPTPGGTPINQAAIVPPATPNKAQIFAALRTQFSPGPSSLESGKPPVTARVRKQLPVSYQTATNYAPGRTDLVSTDESYSCAIKHGAPSTYTPLPPQRTVLPWGKVVGFLLRNSDLAEAAGLIVPLKIQIDPKSLTNGAFIYLSLSSTSDVAALEPDGLLIYAARIPILSGSRAIFTPILFPVATPPPSTDYGDIFAEVEDYDDGFAKAVHCTQPQQLDLLNETPDGSRPAKETGIRIGWDDEQVAIWLNRQLNAPTDSPIGVQGYRIDTRLNGASSWTSLVHARGPIGINQDQSGNFQVPLGTYDGELAVEIHPVQLQAQKQGDFWLPLYFCSWYGPSVVTLDRSRFQLMGRAMEDSSKRVVGQTPEIALKYGQSYDFRVRLADHTGGGPDVTATATNPGPSVTTTIKFRRWIRPMAASLVETLPIPPDPQHPPTTLSLKRPLLYYPAVACTGFYQDVFNKLVADIPAAKAQSREPGLSDPMIDRLQITIEVKGLTQDTRCTDGQYFPLTTTTRPFPSDPDAPIVLDLAWVDIENVDLLEVSDSGPIALPTARDIRLQMVPLGFNDPKNLFFGADDVRYGRRVQAELRSSSKAEPVLFAGDTPSSRFSAYFFQPDVKVDAAIQAAQRAAGNANLAPTDLGSRMAAELGLRNDGLKLQAQPGRRVVFGCSSAINHHTGPDLATITFTSQSDIALHWLVMIKLKIGRDWSWDGLADKGIMITRDGQQVGAFSPNHNVNKDALENPDRSQTDLIFFDAIDPKPVRQSFPQELTPEYVITATFKSQVSQDGPLSLKIRLPITTPPSQTPNIVSAGLAMSPYNRSTDYSRTSVRDKSLWFEFDAAPSDPRDQYFARVLRNVPDPILITGSAGQLTTQEPPLPVDSESVRRIVQGQSDDSAGLNAMQLMVKAENSNHWLLPLPPGIHTTSPELFGFYTYEFRVGHVGIDGTDLWTTAQGRFGPPLRVTGVQHPSPPLTVTLERTSAGIFVSAPYASAILDGVSVQPLRPRSTIWILLYAQAMQLDGQDMRNILITKIPAVPPSREVVRRRPPVAYGEAVFDPDIVSTTLSNLGFRAKAPLSVLAVEMMPQDSEPADALGADLGGQRILRTSPLTPVPFIC